MKPFSPTLRKFFPFLVWWPRVSRNTLRADLLAGLTGALIVLPQGVAFATIAGLPPQYGLYAAMVPAVIAALFGSSWHLVSGPTTAISIAIYAALSHRAAPGSEQYIALVLTLTFLVGVFQLTLGLARMGALVNFISHSVVIGFTAGAAILIAASQVGSFFGIAIPRGTPFYEIVGLLVTRFADINPWVAGVGLITLVSGILARRYVRQIPYMIAAMLVGGLVAAGFVHWQGDAAGIVTVGALPGALPPLSMPNLSLDALRTTLGPALAITMLALTEAVSIGRAISVRSEQRIDGNQEFIGQGLSNIVGAFFSAYASSGSFNRSGVNYEAGARTPLASVFATVFLIAVLLAVAPLAAYLPTAAMAGILFLVAWGLIDFRHIRHIWHTSKSESAILFATLGGTLFNIEAGIFLGVILSLMTYLHRVSRPEIAPLVPAPEAGAYHFVRAEGRPECPQMRIMSVNGAVFFGSANYVQQALQEIDEANPQQKSVLISAVRINHIDIAGAEILAQEARRRRRMGGGLYFYRLNDEAYNFLRRGEYVDDIGRGAFFPVRTDVTQALYRTLDPDICRTCTKRIFRACHSGILPDGLRRQRLLFATDGTEYSERPREIALALASRFGVRLDVATIVASAEDDEQARERLAVVADAARPMGVETKLLTRYGKPAVKEVVATAAETASNLLIIGRRPPRGDLKERLLGDNAMQIIATAPCHVLIAGWQARMWQTRILFAADFSTCANAVEIATQLSRVSATPLTLLAAGDGSEEERTADAEYVAGQLRLEGCVCDFRLAEDTLGPATLKAAGEVDADLVILCDPRRKYTDQVVGSLACAVLVVKSGGDVFDIEAAVARQS
ncbi:MAG TPA: sulfate permease [Rhodocyclaceae bacterium]|nr:sulfate permease [Rhodocyclaceae bacterium]